MQFYEDACFLEQDFVMDDSIKVQKLLQQASESVGVPIKLSSFIRVQCGQGLEDDSKKDFAVEVAETLQKMAQ